MNQRKLSDILLSTGAREQLEHQWQETQAAGELEPLPSGTYVAHVQSVELFTARTGTPGVKIQFRVAEGEHAGRMVFHDSWLTAAALPQTKRDCVKLGLDSLEKLEGAAVPPGRIRCKVRVALRKDDAGERFNKVRGFEVLGIDEPTPDTLAPAEENGEPTAAETPVAPPAEGDASFNFGANADRPATDSAGGVS